MQVLSTVTKTTQGRVSTWNFCQDGEVFFALRTAPQLKVRSCADIEDLRNLYKTYITKYDFVKV